MRHAVFVLLLALGGATAASAQTSVGVLGGVNFSNLSVDLPDAAPAEFDFSFDARTAFVAGIFADIALKPSLLLESGIFFSQQGATADDDEFGEGGTVELTYLNVPVLVKGRTSLGSNTSLEFFAGPQFGFKLAAEADSEGDDDDQDIGDQIETFDFGVVFGGGVTIGRALLQGRYTLGLRSVLDIDAPVDDTGSLKNRVFTLLAGVRF